MRPFPMGCQKSCHQIARMDDACRLAAMASARCLRSSSAALIQSFAEVERGSWAIGEVDQVCSGCAWMPERRDRHLFTTHNAPHDPNSVMTIVPASATAITEFPARASDEAPSING